MNPPNSFCWELETRAVGNPTQAPKEKQVDGLPGAEDGSCRLFLGLGGKPLSWEGLSSVWGVFKF